MTAEDEEAGIAALVVALKVKDARIVELEQENASQREALSALQKTVEELRELVNRNSRNSHLPPSSDPPGSAGKLGRGKDPTGRKRGGQKGRRGAYRSLAPVDRVDDFVEMYPDACEGCAAVLPKVPDPKPRRHQLLELLSTGPHVTEFRRHEVTCDRCGHRTRAAYDEDTIPSSPFGPRLVSVVAMFTGAYHLSRRQAQQLLRELYDVEVSLGAISRMEARASKALVPAAGEAQREVEDAEVKHADGTSWLRAGKRKALWTVASALATVYRILDDGCRDTIQPLFGKMPKGILVSDRATVFDFWSMEYRQVCWAHIIRRFVSFSERSGDAGAIGRELLEYAALVFEYWHGFKDGKLTRDELVAWMSPLQCRLEAALERAVAAAIPGVSGSCADVLAHRDALWNFVTLEGVEPTNNHAERELRAFVLWRRRSFGSQSDRGERFAERVMTVVHTARKLGRSALDFLVACCTASVRGTTPPRLLAEAPYRPP